MAACITGGNAVEFALVAPLLLMFVLAGLHVGLYLGTAHALAQVAADTARHAMVGQTPDDRRRRAEDWFRLSGGGHMLIDPGRIQLSVAEAGGLLRVSLDYDVSDMPIPTIVRRFTTLPSSIRQSSSVATR